MSCPNCGVVDRHIIKHGKRGSLEMVAPPGAADGRAQVYRCTSCYLIRYGRYFGLPEFFDVNGEPVGYVKPEEQKNLPGSKVQEVPAKSLIEFSKPEENFLPKMYPVQAVAPDPLIEAISKSKQQLQEEQKHGE